MVDSQPQSSGYKPIFGTDSKDGSKKPVPKWVPVTLVCHSGICRGFRTHTRQLAISTAAMVVPIVLLRRHRAASRRTLANAPPPPRRTTSLKGTPIANPASSPSVFSMRDSAPASPMSSSSANASAKSGDNFNGALHCAKAFGAATLIVGVGTFASVWGVRQYMGVETVSVRAVAVHYASLTILWDKRHKNSRIGCDLPSLHECLCSPPAYIVPQHPKTVMLSYPLKSQAPRPPHRQLT